MELQELRREIDQIDDQLIRLFLQRMDVAEQIADYKKMHDLPVFVPSREQEKLSDLEIKAGTAMAGYIRELYLKIFELSRSHQATRNSDGENTL